jgi:hypothetical protein
MTARCANNSSAIDPTLQHTFFAATGNTMYYPAGEVRMPKSREVREAFAL